MHSSQAVVCATVGVLFGYFLVLLPDDPLCCFLLESCTEVKPSMEGGGIYFLLIMLSEGAAGFFFFVSRHWCILCTTIVYSLPSAFGITGKTKGICIFAEGRSRCGQFSSSHPQTESLVKLRWSLFIYCSSSSVYQDIY